MSNAAVGSPQWFQELLDKLKNEVGENWHEELAKEMLAEDRKKLLEALGRR